MQNKKTDHLDAMRYWCTDINNLELSMKSEPIYKHTKKWDCNGNWPERDDLPIKDPIGDVEEDEWVEGYKQWKKDNEAYEATMKPHLLTPEGKIDLDYYIKKEKKCTCGTQAVYGKVPVNAHSPHCELREKS